MIYFSKDVGPEARDKLEEVVSLFQNQTQGNGTCSYITLKCFSSRISTGQLRIFTVQLDQLKRLKKNYLKRVWTEKFKYLQVSTILSSVNWNLNTGMIHWQNILIFTRILLWDLVISGELTKYGLFPFSLWVLVILMEAFGIIWGLVFIGFAIFNICGKPIETITGPLGLYLWKGLACKCTTH